jgi:hypothetical protein
MMGATTSNRCSAYPVDHVDNTNDNDGDVGCGGQTVHDDGSTPLIPGQGSAMNASSKSFAPFECLPNEVLLHVLGFLDVSDLLATSRVSSTVFLLLEECVRCGVCYTQSGLKGCFWHCPHDEAARFRIKTLPEKHMTVALVEIPVADE